MSLSLLLTQFYKYISTNFRFSISFSISDTEGFLSLICLISVPLSLFTRSLYFSFPVLLPHMCSSSADRSCFFSFPPAHSSHILLHWFLTPGFSLLIYFPSFILIRPTLASWSPVILTTYPFFQSLFLFATLSPPPSLSVIFPTYSPPPPPLPPPLSQRCSQRSSPVTSPFWQQELTVEFCLTFPASHVSCFFSLSLSFCSLPLYPLIGWSSPPAGNSTIFLYKTWKHCCLTQTLNTLTEVRSSRIDF